MITVSSDAYTTVRSDKYQSASIYLDSKSSDDDLSKLSYHDKLRQALIRKGHELVSHDSIADLIISFDISVSQPTVHTSQGVDVKKGGTSTETIVNHKGKIETVAVTTPDTYKPTYSEYFTYEKKLILKLREKDSQKLVWQATSIIENGDKSYAPYASALVYTAMENFLKDSKKHPHYSRYGASQRNKIEAADNEK